MRTAPAQKKVGKGFGFSLKYKINSRSVVASFAADLLFFSDLWKKEVDYCKIYLSDLIIEKEESYLQDTKKITFFSMRKKVELDSNSILYIMMKRDKATIHASGNKIYDTWISLCELKKSLGDEFLMAGRGCLEEKHAADWIFRYGNQALEKLEKVPLEQMIGNTFGSLFANMDSRWLCSYERAALYREELEMMDYSPEINSYLKIICFPTFPGHCGCILFDLSDIKFVENSCDAKKAKKLYFGD